MFAEAFGGFKMVDPVCVLDARRAVDRIRYIPSLVYPRMRSRNFASALARHSRTLSRLYAAIAAVAGADIVIWTPQRMLHMRSCLRRMSVL